MAHIRTRTPKPRASNPLWITPALFAVTLGCASTIGEPGEGSSGGSHNTGATPGFSGSGPFGPGGTDGFGGSSATAGSSATSGGSATQVPGQEPPAGPRPVNLEGAPLYTRFKRLTNDQWENSVRDILRLDGPTGASDGFLDAVAGTTDFDNNERVVLVDNTAWRDFQLAAESVADQVTASDAALERVVAATDPNAFIRTFGRRAFRRDVTDAELTAYRAIFDKGSSSATGTQSAFTKGARYVISTMLQSPHFLYRSEMGDDGAPLSGYEMAAKLSLWLRDTTPSDAMLDAASSFATADGAVAQATQMLEDRAAVAVMRKFHASLYKFALYDSIAKTGVSGYSEAMNPEFKEASYLFFDRVFSQNLGIREILTSKVGFVGPNTASIYGLQPSGSGLTQVELPDRTGYFTQAPFLALWARNNEPDSIHRGARLNLDTLCADPGLPSVVPSLPSPGEGQTNRMVVTQLTTGCAKVCHGEIINPIGFAFENFDGLGRTRTTDNGQPVDTTGEYPFKEGRFAFSGAEELMGIIASGSQAHQCWAKKMASYALERDLVEADRPLVESLGAVSQASGASLKSVMLALVESDAFRLRVGGVK